MTVTLVLPGQPVVDDQRDLDPIRGLLDVQVLATHEVIGVVRGAIALRDDGEIVAVGGVHCHAKPSSSDVARREPSRLNWSA